MFRLMRDTVFLFSFGGFGYGTILGTLAGTLIFPWVGTAFSSAWGLGLGIAMGLGSSACMVVYLLVTRGMVRDWVAYRRTLSVVMGGLIAIGTGGLLIATTRGFLWDDYNAVAIPYYLVASVAAALFWGGLAGAYTASRHADWQATLMTKQKHGLDLSEALLEKRGTVAQVLKLALQQWWVVPLAMAGSFLLTWVSTGYQMFGSALLYGLVLSVGALLVYGLAVGMLLAFLNRLYFAEYCPDLSLAGYRRRTMWLVGLFLLIVSTPLALMVFGIFGPLLAILVALIGVRVSHAYAAWYYGKDKAKAVPSSA